MFKKHLVNLNGNIHYIKRYTKYIESLIDQDISGYSERHHILPKSLFPQFKNNSWNIIRLTARQHFIAHWMLAKAFGEGMWIALYMMTTCDENGNRNYMVSSNLYGTLKVKRAEILSEKWSGESNPMYGSSRFGDKNPMHNKSHSEETRKKISEKAKKRFENPEYRLKVTGENNGMYGKTHSDEFKKNMSERVSGKNHHNYNKPMADNVKEALIKANSGIKRSDEFKNKISNALKGKKKPPSQAKKLSERKKGSKRVYNEDGSFFVCLKENLYKYHYRDNKYYSYD